jgi:hypothetical protein
MHSWQLKRNLVRSWLTLSRWLTRNTRGYARKGSARRRGIMNGPPGFFGACEASGGTSSFDSMPRSHPFPLSLIEKTRRAIRES